MPTTVFTYQQLRSLWMTAGGAPKEADTAAAVAEAESHGRLSAHNAHDPSGGSWCLWQINGAHRGVFNVPGLSHDPYACALAAVYVRHVQGWNAWSTHRYGTYRVFLAHHAHAAAPRRHIHHVAHTAHVHHYVAPAPAGETLSFLGLCFAFAVGLLLCWNLFRVGCRLVEVSVREEIAARKRYCRRRRYREEAALRRRMMPRASRRLALDLG